VAFSSMTGFARAEGTSELCSWVWEAKSVNAKGIDVRVRVPHGFERLETEVRGRGKKLFGRGNISLNLNVNWHRAGSTYRVVEETLDGIIAVLPALREQVPDAAPPSLDGLLGLKGVMEAVDEPLDEDATAALDAAFLEGLDDTLNALRQARDEEGARLGNVLSGQLTEIETQCVEAGKLAALRPDAIKQRLADQVKELADSVSGITEERLAQEAALLMLKADVREELDRLTAHIAAAHELMAQEGAVGRRFDFLCQEFNREANTLCSKSSDVALTRVGLELKAVIDQMREQVQNVE